MSPAASPSRRLESRPDLERAAHQRHRRRRGGNGETRGVVCFLDTGIGRATAPLGTTRCTGAGAAAGWTERLVGRRPRSDDALGRPSRVGGRALEPSREGSCRAISCVVCWRRCRVMGCCASHDLAAPEPGSAQFAADAWRSGEKCLGRRALLSSLDHWRSRTAGRPGAAAPTPDFQPAKSDAKTASEWRYQWRTAERLSDLGRGD